MAMLSDEDLSFRPGGENLPLGLLCREIGKTQVSYIESFKSFSQDFTYRNEEAGLEGSVAQLTAWYEGLDGELKTVMTGFTDEELENGRIDRGGNFIISPRIQLEIYKEALLIFYGKTSVYLKAMDKELPEQWLAWIG
jgi:hypothetical protein